MLNYQFFHLTRHGQMFEATLQANRNSAIHFQKIRNSEPPHIRVLGADFCFGVCVAFQGNFSFKAVLSRSYKSNMATLRL